MERHEIPVDALRDVWVEAIERGEEVVVVRDGRVVAEIKAPRAKAVDMDAIRAIRAKLPKLPGNAADFVRDIRDDPRW